MSNLKEIRTRITSVKSTKQITSAMKMVSAAKLKKAQDAVINLRPYANKLHQILSNINQSLEKEEENIYSRPGTPEKILIISVTSNKGLCGAFNTNVTKQVLSFLKEDYKEKFEEGNVSIISIGKKGTEFFQSSKIDLFNSNIQILDNLNFESALPFIEDILQGYVNKQFDKVVIVYNKFKNAAVQELTAGQFLPIELPAERESNEKFDYIFEPSKEEIVQELIPKSLKIEFYEALLESLAAEHGARMTAMHKATDNATEIIRDLQLTYNKARQASITNEILEIVGGAEALKN